MIADNQIIESNSSIAPKRLRRLTFSDAEAIAKLVSTRKLTEIECCLMLDIKPQQWFLYKSRHKQADNFANLITRMKADKLAGLVDKIEKSGDDAEIMINGKPVVKRGDWRANAWIAERLAPERFALNTNKENSSSPIINISVMAEAAKRIYDIEEVKPKMLKNKIKLPTR